MKVAIIYNKDLSSVINKFGRQNKETYNSRTVGLVAESLETSGHNVEIIDGNMEVIEALQGFMPKVLEGEKMGMVFNMAYGIQGESRYTHIPSLLEMIGIPYIGSNPSGHALALDKVITKIIMQKHNIPTPNFWVYSSHHEDMADVVYPVIVKPKMEAVSFGLRVVHNETDLKEAVEFIIDKFKQQALVEQFIRGREFAVGLLGNDPVEAFPVLEFDLGNDPDAIQSVSDKRKNPRTKICPADIPEKLAVKMQEASIRAFKALQLHDFSRVDIRLDEKGNFYILEINSMASLGRTGSYTFAAKAAGLEYQPLVNKILDVAARRYFGNQYLEMEAGTPQVIESASLRMRSYLRDKQTRYKDILKSLINCNSYVRNIEGVNQVLGIVKKHMTDLGFSYQVDQQAEIGNVHFYTNSDSNDYDILFIGNVDSPSEIANNHYFEENDRKIFGTGVWEHKGGLVVLIAALQALKSVKALSKKRIGVLLTTDGTLRNKVTAPMIRSRSMSARSVVGLKGASIDSGMVTSRSGFASYVISMNLKDYESVSSVTKAGTVFNKLIGSLLALSNKKEGLLVSASSIAFNSNILNFSANGRVNLSIRYNHTEQIEKIESRIFEMIPKKYSNLLDFYVSVGNKRPVMHRTPLVEELWKVFKRNANRLDIRLREEHRWSASDICFVPSSKCLVDGVGPVGLKDENGQEYILKHSLVERSALLASVIHSLNANLWESISERSSQVSSQKPITAPSPMTE